MMDDTMLDLDSDDGESFMSFLAHMGMGGQVRGRGAMAHDDSVLSKDAARVARAKAGHLFSIALFALGSVLYLVLVVWDYQWAKMVQPWPREILESYHDDIVYNNYRLKLLYYGTTEAVEESEVGGRAMRAMRMNRVSFPMIKWEVEGVMRSETRAREGREDEREAYLPPPSSSQVETLYWEDLTPGYKLGYFALGSNKTLWNSGGSVPADELTWEELSDAHRTVLIIMGLGQEVWDAASPGEHFPSQPEAPLSEVS